MCKQYLIISSMECHHRIAHGKFIATKTRMLPARFTYDLTGWQEKGIVIITLDAWIE